MKRILSIGLIAFILFSCGENECCFEPADGAFYFINNQTTSDLKVSFVTSEELGLQLIDSISPIPTSRTSMILTDGIIGVNPKPSNSFSSLTFLRTSDSSEYKISTIINATWNVISRDFEQGEYGLTEYELEIDDSKF